VQALIKAWSYIDHQDKKGRTVLHKAVASGQVRLVEVLLAAGVNTGLKDKRGRTAQSLARERSDSRMYEMLKPEEKKQ